MFSRVAQWSLAIAWLGSGVADAAEKLPDVVKVASAPGRKWHNKPTRTLADLPPIPADPEGSRFGGLPVKFGQGTGYFRVVNPEGRWWLVDPEGYLFIHRGVTSVNETRTKAANESLLRDFGSVEKWAEATGGMLKDHGFNGLGSWCDIETLEPASKGLVYTQLRPFMSSYARERKRTHRLPGHTGYEGDCPLIFDLGFAEFCDRTARDLAENKDDPWLLGYFTDNELPWSLEMLERYLSLPKTEPGYLAALKWLQERHGPDAGIAEIKERDKGEFVGFAADTYFATVTKAIRKYDPNHLILGSRFHGRALSIPELFEAAGRHVDVVSVNYYHAWTPDAERMDSWSEGAGRPVLVSEWYAKAEDSKMGNKGGVGWLVKTQADRAAFYQNYTLGLLESQRCVGWHWFRYSDNDPGQKGVDASNRDSNKGIVTSHYKPYRTLLDAMKEINVRTYGIVRHFDNPKRSRGGLNKTSSSNR
ncbi:hypothetical protein [Haloferula sp.]|uniref:hypothetical protein n=1 Tax=Haloferula sp. TaxID=2497595 RepID=UPI00329C75CB